ncbi:uncharacterized protein LOC110325526 [Mus pahari]|uniref:uncharacterized protein LOC110325526 n=1 Tax=Mus pahari TaxID=10093 RepID=UPI001114A3BB|nr:uncharacterized protein LOC110325526 [Mus pahari]
MEAIQAGFFQGHRQDAGFDRKLFLRLGGATTSACQQQFPSIAEEALGAWPRRPLLACGADFSLHYSPASICVCIIPISFYSSRSAFGLDWLKRGGLQPGSFKGEQKDEDLVRGSGTKRLGTRGTLAPRLERSTLPNSTRPDLRTSEARGPQQESSGRLIPTDPGKGPQQLCPAARPARLHQDSTLKEKAWKRKDAGEQRAYGGRGCYLIVCDWGSCGRKDAVVLSSSRSPTPHPPCCQCARTSTRRQLFLSHSSFFHLIFSPSPPFLSTFPSFLLSSLSPILPPSLPSFLPFHPSFFLSFLPSFFPSFLLPSSGERPLSPCSQRTLI